MPNRIFFPQATLDQAISEGSVELQGAELTIVAEGWRYELVEAFHVERELTGGTDPNDWVGRVKPLAVLEAAGAEILESSMICGDFAYDVIPGWLGVPSGVFENHEAVLAKTFHHDS